MPSNLTVRCATASLALVWSLVSAAVHAQETLLLRFPTLHGDHLVFSHGGDLWRSAASGGVAVRLTAHPGVELFPRFSPDGTRIAFTAQYDGDEQVYVMPAGGGEPQRLTWYPATGPLPDRWGYDNQVYGWTPDGSGVLFRSLRDTHDVGASRLYIAPLSGGMPEVLPMTRAGGGALSPDGQRIVYSPLFRDFRTWKRYEGGWAQQLYVLDLDGSQVERISEHPRSHRDPMWLPSGVYYVSDRDGTLNIYRYDPDSGETTQLTRHDEWDVRWPSADGEQRIVYELGGRLRILDVVTGEDRAVSITVPSDGVPRRPARISVSDRIQEAAPAPDGNRVAIVARGEVFSVPAEHGLTRNLTRSSDAHDREVAWSPTGDRVAFISDRSGEEELWVVDQAGGEPRQVTQDSDTRYFRPRFSPDGERIAMVDARNQLVVVDVSSGRITVVARDPFENNRDHVWSPDGRWLAFSMSQPSGFSRLHLWERERGRLHALGSGMFHEHTPAWDPEGGLLYFLAMREFQPQISRIEWDYATNRDTGIFAYALSRDVDNPFAPRSDEVGDEAEVAENDDESTGQDARRREDEADTATLRVELEGLDKRVIRVPVDTDNYSQLTATGTHLVYGRSDPFFYGREPATRPVVMLYDIEKREASTRLEDVSGFVVSADGKQLLARQNGTFKLYPLAKGDGKTLSLDGLMMDRIPAEEWAQIFDEVWRRFRDHFYVANMHGYDWEAIGQRYRALLPHVAHRSDLNYVIGEMIGELNVSHAYKSGGDLARPSRPTVSLPGARFELDERAGRYRIASIFAGQNAEARYRSPLTEVGVDVSVGDYVLAINGHPLDAQDNPYRLLHAARGAPVELSVSARSDGRDARTVRIDPVESERDLMYLAWVNERYRRVNDATDGRVGYLHVPDMGANGIREFIKWFYPQIRREGLIIDVRANGGGNVSQMLMNRLNRELLSVTHTRHWQRPNTYPSMVFTGPMVTLINETSASDGDIFPWQFRKAGLGPLIGKRTWGGIVGITNRGPLVDGGEVSVPEFGTADADGSWAVEGEGITPDIEVDNDPLSEMQGRDPQLERAIQEVRERMRTQPAALPARPADPVKTP